MPRMLAMLAAALVFLAPLDSERRVAESLARSLAESCDSSTLEPPSLCPADETAAPRPLNPFLVDPFDVHTALPVCGGVSAIRRGPLQVAYAESNRARPPEIRNALLRC